MKVEIVNLIEMLEEIVNNGGKVPFSNKITVDKDEVLSVLNEMRMRLPSDIKLAIDILDEKQRILMNAQKSAKEVIDDAKKEREEMIEEHEITKRATAYAEDIVEKAQTHAKEMRAGTTDYVDGMLEEFQEYLKDKIRELDENRKSLR